MHGRRDGDEVRGGARNGGLLGSGDVESHTVVSLCSSNLFRACVRGDHAVEVANQRTRRLAIPCTAIPGELTRGGERSKECEELVGVRWPVFFVRVAVFREDFFPFHIP